MSYGQRLHKAMLIEGVTVTELSRRTGISRDTIYGYLSDRRLPDIERFCDICKALKWAPGFFLEDYFKKEVW